MPLGRALAVWLVIIVAETIHGILRSLFLVPVVGDLRARQIGVPIGTLIILAIAITCIQWIGVTSLKQLLAVGALWLAFTMAFEFVLGLYVLGLSWERLLSDYNPAQGGYLALGMIMLAFSPLIAAKLRGLPVSN